MPPRSARKIRRSEAVLARKEEEGVGRAERIGNEGSGSVLEFLKSPLGFVFSATLSEMLVDIS